MLAFSPTPVARVAMTQIPGRVLDGGSWRVVDPAKVRYPTIADIAREVADKHKMTMTKFKEKGRHNLEAARARHEAFYRTAQLGRFTYPQIARFYDLDHTTVIYGVRAYKARNPHLAEKETTK